MCLLDILGLQILNLVSYNSTAIYGVSWLPLGIPRPYHSITYSTCTKINHVSSFLCCLLGVSLLYSRISRNSPLVNVSPASRSLSSLQWLQFSKKLKTTWLLLHGDMSTGCCCMVTCLPVAVAWWHVYRLLLHSDMSTGCCCMVTWLPGNLHKMYLVLVKEH